jgi:hypothetical protein
MKKEQLTKKEIGIKIRAEEVKIDRIRNFLRANAGLSYSTEAIAKETGINCVDNLLYFRHRDYAKAVGIKRRDLVSEDALGYCSTARYYHVNEKLLKQLWKRKGAKAKWQKQ